MRGRARDRSSSRHGAAIVLALAALLALGVTQPAAAKTKKKGGGGTATRTASTPIAPGTQQATTAVCTGKNHVTGGGWSVTPSYTNGSGSRITHLQSQSAGSKSWVAGAAAFTAPITPGTFTTYARCESNTLGKLAGGVSGTTTIPVDQGTTVTLNCAPGTHVLAGGFNASPAGDLADATALRMIVVESQRVDVDTWEIRAVNPSGAPSPVTLTTNVLCERNAKGVNVTAATVVVPIPNDARATAAPACTGKKHSIGGGFLISPNVSTSPAVGIDQMQPSGQKAWLVGLYEYPGFNLPAGSTLTAYSYCKKNAAPK